MDHVPPGAEPILDAAPLSDEQLDRFRSEWERQKLGPPRLLTPLPHRVRLRLAAARAVDRVAIRLVNGGHYRAAMRLWKAFGMWRH